MNKLTVGYGTCSCFLQFCRSIFRCLRHLFSTVLHTFAHMELSGVNSTMNALNLERSALWLMCELEHRPYLVQVFPPDGCNLPTTPPPNTVRRTLSQILTWFLLRMLDSGARNLHRIAATNGWI